MIYGLHIVLCLCIHVIGQFLFCFIVKNVFVRRMRKKSSKQLNLTCLPQKFIALKNAGAEWKKKLASWNINFCTINLIFLSKLASINFFLIFHIFFPTCKCDPVNRNKFYTNCSFIILSFNCYSVSFSADITDCKTSLNALFCDTIVTSCTKIREHAIC